MIEADDEDGGWVDTYYFLGKCLVVDNLFVFYFGV